jgi:hypothetical protein
MRNNAVAVAITALIIVFASFLVISNTAYAYRHHHVGDAVTCWIIRTHPHLILDIYAL